MLGLEDDMRTLRKAMMVTGADMSIVRNWMKSYEKAKKQVGVISNRYRNVRADLQTVCNNLKCMEQMIIGYEEFDPIKKRQFIDGMKEIKRLQPNFTHEFLISKEDREFHTTVDTLYELGMAYASKQQNGVIIQSEIENLLALTEEALERPEPELFALGYYYLNRSDKELIDLPYTDKLLKVKRIYENEFLSAMKEQLMQCIAKANEMAPGLAERGRREIAVLLDASELGADYATQAEGLLYEYCRAK